MIRIGGVARFAAFNSAFNSEFVFSETGVHLLGCLAKGMMESNE